jgi:hypothetical protein
MIKAAPKRQRAVPGLMLLKTTVIVLAIRDRPVYDNCHPFLKDKGKGIRDKVDLVARDPLRPPTITATSYIKDKSKGIKDETDLPLPWRIIIRI